MSELLLAYATGEGQTKKVTDVIGATLAEAGHTVRTVDVTRLPAGIAVEDYDAVIVGASIHVGTHQPAVVSFVSENLDAISRRPSAFFQVSLSAALPDAESQTQAARYIEDLLARTGWEPDRIASFGGALRYSEYGFLVRTIIKRIAGRTTGDTDTSREYEYTDWDEVESFANDFATGLAAEMPPIDDDSAALPAVEDRPDVPGAR